MFIFVIELIPKQHIFMSNDIHNMNEYSALWFAYLEGDKKAFSSLYRLSYKSLYSYGISFGIEDQQIRDTIQELFLKLYSGPKLVKDPATLRAYLYASMRNSFINYQKIQQRQLCLEQGEEFHLKYSINNVAMEDKEEQEAIKIKLDSLLKLLTPRQKEIIYLRFLHQMEYEEISRIMNLSDQAARNLIHRAMKKMRDNDSNYMSLLSIMVLLPIDF